MNSPSNDNTNCNINTGLSELFKKKREELKFSRQIVADYVEISAADLEVYETGTKPIPLNIIHALSNCLSISPETVLKIMAEV